MSKALRLDAERLQDWSASDGMRLSADMLDRIADEHDHPTPVQYGSILNYDRVKQNVVGGVDYNLDGSVVEWGVVDGERVVRP